MATNAKQKSCPISELQRRGFYSDDEVVITISHLGYQHPAGRIPAQGRGGVRREQIHTRSGLHRVHLSRGARRCVLHRQRTRCYWLRVYEIEGHAPIEGTRHPKHTQHRADDRINAFLHVLRKLRDEDFCKSHYVVFATQRGVIENVSHRIFSSAHQRRERHPSISTTTTA